MSKWAETTIEDHEFAVKYGRPKTELPLDTVLELNSKGYTCRDIAKELGKLGIKTSKDTVNRFLREINKKS